MARSAASYLGSWPSAYLWLSGPRTRTGRHEHKTHEKRYNWEPLGHGHSLARGTIEITSQLPGWFHMSLTPTHAENWDLVRALDIACLPRVRHLR